MAMSNTLKLTKQEHILNIPGFMSFCDWPEVSIILAVLSSKVDCASQSTLGLGRRAEKYPSFHFHIKTHHLIKSLHAGVLAVLYFLSDTIHKMVNEVLSMRTSVKYYW
jgi:hypothetical protein